MRDFTAFISYSQHDGQDFAESLNELLQSVFSDIRVFWDTQIYAGEGLWDRLHEEVRHCNVFLYLVSDCSTTMPSGCIREFNWACHYEKHVVPCILPTFSGDPTNILGLSELSHLLFIDLRKGIENCTAELASLYGALYDSILNASPLTQYHRREMMMLYEILGQLQDKDDSDDYYESGTEVYARGYEYEYDEYPAIYGRVSESVCREVIDMLDMMDMLQRSWNEISDLEQKRVQNETNEYVEFTIKQVGFWPNEEGDHFAYMKFLNRRGKFTWMSYADNNGNSHSNNVASYRAMLQEYNRIKHDDSNDFWTTAGRFVLSVDEVIRVIQASYGARSYPL